MPPAHSSLLRSVVKAVRSDQGTEFSIKVYCDRTSIIRQTTSGCCTRPQWRRGARSWYHQVQGSYSCPVGTSRSSILVPRHGLRRSFLSKIRTSGIDGKTVWQVITGRETNLDSVREFGELRARTPRTSSKVELRERKRQTDAHTGQDKAITGYIVRYEDNGAVGRSRDMRAATRIPLGRPSSRSRRNYLLSRSKRPTGRFPVHVSSR